jgi:hypothetical protein
MRAMRWVLPGFLAIFGLLVSCTTLNDGRIVLSGCTPILAPGSYVLTGNLNATGDCLRVNANNVSIDLNGFTITGNGSGIGITTLDANRRNVAVSNGNITNFESGIEMRNARDVIIEKIRATNNTRQGIRVGLGGSGIPSKAIIKDCIAVENGSTDIVTVGVLSNTIAGRVTAASAVTIGCDINYLDADHGIVINNVGETLLVGNCPALVMGNNFTNLHSLDPPPIFATDCKVIENIPSGLTTP